VPPPHYKETQKKQKEEASKDVPAIASPGHVMALVRNVVNSNASLTGQEKKAVICTVGKAIFKRGYFSRIQKQPAALRDLLTLLAAPRPPGKPSPKAAVRSIYGWMFGLIGSVVSKHELGIGALIRQLQAHVTPTLIAADPPRQRHRLRYRPARRLTYAERGKVPSWAR